MSNEENVNEKKLEVNDENKKKKKKGPIRRFFKIIFIIVFILIICAIGLGIYLGVNIVSTENYNGNENVQTIKKENKSLSYVSNYIAYDAIDKVDDDKVMSISLDETNMNYLLHAVSKEMNFGALNVDNMYMYYPTEDSDTYEIYMPMSVVMFKTCLYGSATIVYNEDSDIISINIKELKLGKLSTDNWLVKRILHFVKDETIEASFEKMGLEASVNIKSPSIDIDINAKSLFDMIFTKTKGSAVDLARVVYSNLDRDNKISFDFSDRIGVTCNLDNVVSNELSTNSLENSLDSVKTKMNILISKGIVNETNCSKVWKYLVNGYSLLDDSTKTLILKLNLSSISLTTDEEKKEYSGVIDRSPDNYIFDLGVREIIALQSQEDPAVIFNVPDSFINSKIREKSIIGSTIAFLDNTKTTFNYIIIENIYLKSKNNSTSINILIDINGAEISIELDFDFVSGNDKLVTSLSTIKMGNMLLNEEDNVTILNFLADKCNIDILTFDSENNNVTLDFSSLFGSNLKEVMELFELNSYYSITDGAIVVTIKK